MSGDLTELLEHKVSSLCSPSLGRETNYCAWEMTINVIFLIVFEILFQLAKVDK